MYTTGDEDGLLVFMVPHVLVQTISKALKLRTGLQKVIFIVLKEAPDLLLKSSFQESFDTAPRIFSLSAQFPRSSILLPIRFLDNVGNLVHQAHFLIIVEISTDVFRDGYQRDRILAQAEALDVHFQEI